MPLPRRTQSAAEPDRGKCAPFQLHRYLDSARYRAQFRRDGRVQIAPFLEERAVHALHSHLLDRDDWRQVLNSAGSTFEIGRAGQKSLSETDRTKLRQLIHAAARDGFQYCYETLRVPDSAAERAERRDDPIIEFAEFMSSAPALKLVRHITGHADIAFADAQATCYRPGDFLTGHDDAVGGKNRRAAYVFGLTPGWRAEWGGLLMFHDSAGDIGRALIPRFNCLNIFAVPQLHSVSVVADFAGKPRLSITGWFRSKRPEG